MDALSAILDEINSFVWGPVMLILVLGTGFYLMIGLRLQPLWRIFLAFRLVARRNTDPTATGEVSSYRALATVLAATIGTGNIVGVATAIHLGGLGAIFWMWMTALVGMATKYAEAVLAVKYREIDKAGNTVGGPMYYIRNGLGRNWTWLATAFALFATFASFGIGNMVQSNSVAAALSPCRRILVSRPGSRVSS
jgi:AGCS family alanine or glycine:cation symporter